MNDNDIKKDKFIKEHKVKGVSNKIIEYLKGLKREIFLPYEVLHPVKKDVGVDTGEWQKFIRGIKRNGYIILENCIFANVGGAAQIRSMFDPGPGGLRFKSSRPNITKGEYNERNTTSSN